MKAILLSTLWLFLLSQGAQNPSFNEPCESLVFGLTPVGGTVFSYPDHGIVDTIQFRSSASSNIETKTISVPRFSPPQAWMRPLVPIVTGYLDGVVILAADRNLYLVHPIIGTTSRFKGPVRERLASETLIQPFSIFRFAAGGHTPEVAETHLAIVSLLNGAGAWVNGDFSNTHDWIPSIDGTYVEYRLKKSIAGTTFQQTLEVFDPNSSVWTSTSLVFNTEISIALARSSHVPDIVPDGSLIVFERKQGKAARPVGYIDTKSSDAAGVEMILINSNVANLAIHEQSGVVFWAETIDGSLLSNLPPSVWRRIQGLYTQNAMKINVEAATAEDAPSILLRISGETDYIELLDMSGGSERICG